MLKTIVTVLYKEKEEDNWEEGVLIKNKEGAEFIVSAKTGRVLVSVWVLRLTHRLNVHF